MASATVPGHQPYSSLFVNIVAGGGAGLVETCTTYPLDLARNRIQLQRGPTTGVLSILADVWTQGGPASLYRGLLPPLISEVPRRALKFTANDFFKAKLLDGDGGLSNKSRAALAGALTGATESVAHNPFEVVKVRLQSTQYAHLRHSWHCLTDLIATEGWGSLYRGFEAYLLRQVLWNGVFFGLIGTFHDFRATHEMENVGSSHRTSRMLDSFLTGLVAGSLATLCNTPLDVAKTRLQVCSVDSWGKVAPWSLQVVWQIYREEGGLRACFKGLNARLCRAAPGSGILVLAHDQIMSRLQPVH